MQPRQAAIALGSAAAMAVTSIWATAPADATAIAKVELLAGLHHSAAFPGARGHSKYDQEGAKRELEVTVRVASLSGRSVTVRVHGTFVGRIHVSSGGVANREWKTEHGNRVPHVSAGDTIRVTAPSGRLVASGRYHRHGD